MSGGGDDSDDIFGFLNETALRLRICLVQATDVKQKYNLFSNRKTVINYCFSGE